MATARPRPRPKLPPKPLVKLIHRPPAPAPEPWVESWQVRADKTRQRMVEYLNHIQAPRDLQRPLRILYLSCHGPLEHDELSLFGSIGCRWVSLSDTGEITRPRSVVRGSPLPGCEYDLQEKFERSHPNRIPEELLSWADVLVSMYEHTWVVEAAKRFKKPIIWRAIGQAVPDTPLLALRGQIFTVRMSPNEDSRTIQHCATADAVIRFCKDPNEFAGWTGSSGRAVAVMGMPELRRNFSRIDVLEDMLGAGPSDLYGLHTERDLPRFGRGQIAYPALKEVLRAARVFVTVGSLPGPYTLGLVEAMMTGCPVVTIDAASWAKQHPWVQPMYETDSILAPCGFVCAPDKAAQQIRTLLAAPEAELQQISARTRARAIELFGIDAARELWRAILDPIASR